MLTLLKAEPIENLALNQPVAQFPSDCTRNVISPDPVVVDG